MALTYFRQHRAPPAIAIDETARKLILPYADRCLKRLRAVDLVRTMERHDMEINYFYFPHSVRVARNLGRFCAFLGHSPESANTMSLAMLPHDCGKAALPLARLDSPGKPSAEEKRFRHSHAPLGAAILTGNRDFLDVIPADIRAEVLNTANLGLIDESPLKGVDHPLLDLMADLACYHHSPQAEQSCAVQIAAICDNFDGGRILRDHQFAEGASATIDDVLERMKKKDLNEVLMGRFRTFISGDISPASAAARQQPSPP